MVAFFEDPSLHADPEFVVLVTHPLKSALKDNMCDYGRRREARTDPTTHRRRVLLENGDLMLVPSGYPLASEADLNYHNKSSRAVSSAVVLAS